MGLSVVFLRDDDVVSAGRAFRELFDFAWQHALPVVYGVIPALVDDGMVRSLKQAKERQPALLDIVQHGFLHRNYARTGSKYEFGPSRSYKEQRKDVARGLALMQQRFKGQFTPVFVPPYHGFDAHTLRAVESLPFAAFSAGCKAGLNPGRCLDFPAQLPLNDYAPDGRPLAAPAAVMMARLRQAMSFYPLLGMVYHHDAIGCAAEMKEMKIFFRFLLRLRNEGRVRVVLLSELLTAAGRCHGGRLCDQIR